MRKDIREKFGISQIEMAKLVGVSRSTVQRFEYGTGNNPKIKAFYENMEKNADLIAEFGAVRSETMKRVRELNDDGVTSLSLRKMDNPEHSIIAPIKTIGSNRSELRREIGRMNEFLDSQTSTVEGAKLWESRATKAAEKTFGTSDKATLEMMITVYNRAKNDGEIARYLKDIEYDSTQAIEDIKRVFADRDIGFDDADDLYEKLRDMEF